MGIKLELVVDNPLSEAELRKNYSRYVRNPNLPYLTFAQWMEKYHDKQRT